MSLMTDSASIALGAFDELIRQAQQALAQAAYESQEARVRAAEADARHVAVAARFNALTGFREKMAGLTLAESEHPTVNFFDQVATVREAAVRANSEKLDATDVTEPDKPHGTTYVEKRDPLDYACPACGVSEGEDCRGLDWGTFHARRPGTARIDG